MDPGKKKKEEEEGCPEQEAYETTWGVLVPWGGAYNPRQEVTDESDDAASVPDDDDDSPSDQSN